MIRRQVMRMRNAATNVGNFIKNKGKSQERIRQENIFNVFDEMADISYAKLKANNPINPIERNQPFITKYAGKVYSPLNMSPDEAAGRTYASNIDLKNQIKEKKARLSSFNKYAEKELIPKNAADQKDIDAYKKRERQQIENLESKKKSGLEIAGDYMFGSGDMTKTLTRTGAAVGLYGTGALTIRHSEGGTPTRNANGQRDIAGIPFV